MIAIAFHQKELESLRQALSVAWKKVGMKGFDVYYVYEQALDWVGFEYSDEEIRIRASELVSNVAEGVTKDQVKALVEDVVAAVAACRNDCQRTIIASQGI